MAIQDRRYSKITYDQILTDFNNILSAKEGTLADLGQSSYGKTLLELFAANSDLQAAWIEEAFKESFLESATTPEAIYVGARSLGYSIRRPIPAKAGIALSLKRTGIYPNVKVNIPKGAEFTVAGTTMTAIDDMEFVFDRTDPNFEEGLLVLTSGRAVLAEGTFKTIQFFSDASQNQEFIINDATFADWFGFGDPNYTEPDYMQDRSTRFTVVTSDASLVDNPETIAGSEDKIFWRVSRRGFYDPSLNPNDINDIDNFVSNSVSNKSLNYTALVTTANDGRAKIEFSDGVIGAIPYGTINVKYFSTIGEQGNVLNVAGGDATPTSTDILITQMDGSESDLTTTDINFVLSTDVRGGINTESFDSIKKNASKIYNSLDSLGNGNSYKLFLSRLSDVRYANAFGESILNKVKPTGNFDIRYSNIVRFTLLKDLYREKDGNYFITGPFEYYMEGYKVNGLTYLWDYDYNDLPSQGDVDRFNLNLLKMKSQLDYDKVTFTKNDTTDGDNKTLELTSDEFIQEYIVPYGLSTALVPPSIFSIKLEPKDFIVTGSEVDVVLDNLNRRGYLTLGSGQHSFVQPIVHEMSMVIKLTLFEGSNYNSVKTQAINAVYAYLKEYTEFVKPIFRSEIECLIQRLPEVSGINLTFIPKDNPYTGLDLTLLEWLSEDTAQYVNQVGLSMDGFDSTLTYDYRAEELIASLDETLTFTIANQQELRDAIKEYYKSKIAYWDDINEIYKIRTDLREEDINKFTGYIWSTAMNIVYNSVFELYKEAKAEGLSIEADKIYNVLEALRGWFLVQQKINFKDTEVITDMSEGTDDTLANYKIYTLEYIKLVRNILATTVARQLIDSEGNITNYSDQNEIVQFNITASDISLIVST